MKEDAKAASRDFLEQRLNFLEESNRRYMAILDMIASGGEFHGQLSKAADAGEIFRSTQEQVSRILGCDEIGFMEVDDDGSFHLVTWTPVNCRFHLQRQIDAKIQEGTFAWALNRSQAILSSTDDARTFLLQAIETRSRIRGMLVCVLCEDAAGVDSGALSALSIALSTCAYALENLTLYNMLRNQMDNLEERIVRRTQDLIVARETSEAANRAKDDFLANVSHELRTPLNGILGMNAHLLDSPLSSEQRHYAELMQKSGESLLALVNDLLDISRIEAGKLQMEIQDFDLELLLEEITSLMAIPAHEKGLEFICFVDPQVPFSLQGDAGRLRQVLSNLVGNALKFTEAGEIEINCHLESLEKTSVCLRFIVRDTGHGIPTEKQSLLFKKFSQIELGSGPKTKGTGLGLVISKLLVEMMGGEIGQNSETGSGSEFWFTARFDLQPAAKCRGAFDESLGEARLMVVDDHPGARQSLVALCQRGTAEVLEADSAPRAVELLQKEAERGCRVDIVLVDLHIPGADKLARTAASSESLSGTALILLTSPGRESEGLGPEDLEGAGSLPKPVCASQLFTGLKRVLSGSSLRAQEAQASVPRRSHCLKGTRILLAEDNIINQAVAVGYLRKFGVEVDVAASGREVLDALALRSYDLILMDVQMPEMNGIEATRRIRVANSSASDSKIPIVAMTAHVLAAIEEECLEAGMNDYLTKPIDPQTLEKTLMRWLSGRAGVPSWQPETMKSPASEQQLPVFDQAGMLRRLIDDRDLVHEIVQDFLEDAPKQLSALQSHLEQGDTKAFERIAHSIKGAAANVGALRLKAAALTLEKVAAAGDLNETQNGICNLKVAFSQFRDVIDKSLS